MSQAKLQCWNLLTRRCCIDNVETFISNWVIRVKVNPGIWTSGLEWGWRSSATVFTDNRVLWKKTISNLDRTINHCLGLSDMCQLWTVQTLLKLHKGAQEIVWMVEAHTKFPPDTQKVINRPTSIAVRVLLGVIKGVVKGKERIRRSNAEVFSWNHPLHGPVMEYMLLQTICLFSWVGIGEFCNHCFSLERKSYAHPSSHGLHYNRNLLILGTFP